jgi:hypothetical protein
LLRTARAITGVKEDGEAGLSAGSSMGGGGGQKGIVVFWSIHKFQMGIDMMFFFFFLEHDMMVLGWGRGEWFRWWSSGRAI